MVAHVLFTCFNVATGEILSFIQAHICSSHISIQRALAEVALCKGTDKLPGSSPKQWWEVQSCLFSSHDLTPPTSLCKAKYWMDVQCVLVRKKLPSLLGSSVLGGSIVSLLCNLVDCSPPGSSVHGFSRQEYWSRMPLPTPGDLPDPDSNACLLHLLCWQVDS